MKKLTISYMLEGARLAMAIGVGLFVKGIYKDHTVGKSQLAKAGYWLCSFAATWAIAHSVDSYVNEAKVLTGILNPDGTCTEEFIEECYEL